jgi:hypothetical protein
MYNCFSKEKNEVRTCHNQKKIKEEEGEGLYFRHFGGFQLV